MFQPDVPTCIGAIPLTWKIILWDWQRGEQRLAFSSSHHGNIFQAKPLPGSDNRIIFSCAADGHVLVHTQGSNGTFSSRELGSHDGRAHKIALSPDSTFLLSSGEDGYVRWYDVRAPPASSRATIVAKATTEAAVSWIRKRRQMHCMVRTTISAISSACLLIAGSAGPHFWRLHQPMLPASGRHRCR